MTVISWSLAAIATGSSDRAVARLTDGSLVEIDALPGPLSPLDVVKQWERFAPVLKEWSPQGAKPVVEARLVAPLRYPGKLVCVGANYRDHRSEMRTAVDGQRNEPFFLLKPPTTTIVGPEDQIHIRGDADRVDWEAEVAVVIGKRGRFIEKERALEYVAGYMLANDVSARGVHQRQNPIHAAFAYDWLAAKGQDTFCPIGPAMLPAWFAEDVNDIPFTLTVNGVVEQSGSTSNLIADIATLIHSLSQLLTLEAGDIITTGTPGGVGAAKGRFLVDGDQIELASPILGTFRNTVRLLKQPAGATSPAPTATVAAK